MTRDEFHKAPPWTKMVYSSIDGRDYTLMKHNNGLGYLLDGEVERWEKNHRVYFGAGSVPIFGGVNAERLRFATSLVDGDPNEVL